MLHNSTYRKFKSRQSQTISLEDKVDTTCVMTGFDLDGSPDAFWILVTIEDLPGG